MTFPEGFFRVYVGHRLLVVLRSGYETVGVVKDVLGGHVVLKRTGAVASMVVLADEIVAVEQYADEG